MTGDFDGYMQGDEFGGDSWRCDRCGHVSSNATTTCNSCGAERSREDWLKIEAGPDETGEEHYIRTCTGNAGNLREYWLGVEAGPNQEASSLASAAILALDRAANGVPS